jgi:ABC-type multidrug transport system ATPase subunit
LHQRPLVSLQALAREFGEHRVFGPLTIDAAAGEKIALVGPNGSGKSSLLRCLAGLLSPSEGSVSIGGHPADTVQARALTGVSLAQERSFYRRLTGRQNLLMFAGLRFAAAAARAAVEAAIEELELAEIAAQRLDRCSTGMTQQLALARALVCAPKVLLLDEPTRSLDTDAIARLWGAIGRRPEVAVFIATHHPEDRQRCERTIDLAA